MKSEVHAEIRRSATPFASGKYRTLGKEYEFAMRQEGVSVVGKDHCSD